MTAGRSAAAAAAASSGSAAAAAASASSGSAAAAAAAAAQVMLVNNAFWNLDSLISHMIIGEFVCHARCCLLLVAFLLRHAPAAVCGAAVMPATLLSQA